MEQIHRNDSFYKVWEVFKPFVIYYVTCQVTILLAIYLCNAAMEYFGSGMRGYLAGQAGTVTELVGGLSMLVGVIPLLPMLRQELRENKVTAGKDVFRNTEDSRAARYKIILITVILAASSSVGVNILLSLTGLVQASESYRDVAKQQYSVVFGVGAVLFGLISPITEEIVFRGLVFNRMRRYYPATAAIIISGVLFGAYHGNLVQGVYGGCMGILLAYTYERKHSFFIPCLFHATANLTVYTLAYIQTIYQNLQKVIFTVPGCIILLIISAVCIFMTEKLKRS